MVLSLCLTRERPRFRSLLAVSFVVIFAVIASAASASDMSQFTGTDGKVRSAKLVKMEKDTLIIETTASDGSVTQRRVHKSQFKKVQLSDNSILDLTTSTWPPVKAAAKDDWDEVAPVAKAEVKKPDTSAVAKSPATVDDIDRLFAILFSQMKTDSATSIPIAVLPFTANGTVPPQAAQMVSEAAVTDISKTKHFVIVERAQLQKVVSEIAFSQTGMVDDSKTLEAGKMLAAKYLVTGSVTEDNGLRLVSARIIETESGSVVASADAKIAVRKMDDLTKALFAEKVDPKSALFRSTVLPGWGQFYTGHAGQGTASLVLAVVGAAAVGYTTYEWSSAKKDADAFRTHSPSTVQANESPAHWLRRGNAAIAKANDAATNCDIAIAALGGVWVLNMVDALICGAVESKKVKKHYFSVIPVLSTKEMGLACNVNF